MKWIVKISGTLLEDSTARQKLAARIKQLANSGHQLLLVHGGGKQLSRYLQQHNIQSQFVDGLRVTTKDALDGVVKILGGTVNHELLASFHSAGVPAVGISGIDAGCLVAEKLVGKQGEDWGFVGKIKRTNPRLWRILLEANILPVMACLAVGDDGQIYNINADQAAVACAVKLNADCLVFLSDVDGVKDADGNILARLDSDEIPRLLKSGAVTGGMLAKLNAIQEALAKGISRVHIANGHRDEILEHLFAGEALHHSAGTVITSSAFATKH